jgi:hypothetical protein
MTTDQHATILGGRVGGALMLQLSYGKMDAELPEIFDRDDSNALENAAQHFATTLRQRRICTTNIHTLDSTVVAGNSQSGFERIDAGSVGGEYLEAFQRRVVTLMNEGGQY